MGQGRRGAQSLRRQEQGGEWWSDPEDTVTAELRGCVRDVMETRLNSASFLPLKRQALRQGDIGSGRLACHR